MLWLIVILSAAAAILCYKSFETRLDRELRKAVLCRLNEIFPQARIRMDRVTIEGPDKISIHGLRMAVRDGDKYCQMLSIERVDLHGDLDVSHCIQDTVLVRRIDIVRPQADVWKLSSGTWSVAALVARNPSGGKPAPVVQLHQGNVSFHRARLREGTPIVFHDVSGAFGEGEVVQTTELGIPIRRLEGKLSAQSSGTCEHVLLDGWYDRSHGRWFAKGSLQGAHFSSDLIQKLPDNMSRSLTQLAGLSCKVNADMEMERNGPDAAWEFRVGGKLEQGRLQDARLPYPLDDLCGSFFCNNESLQLRDVTARSGQASCKFEMDIRGLHPQAPVDIRAEARMLQLDGRLYSALPPKWQSYWDRVQPLGYVDARLELKSDGQTWRPQIELACRDVQVEAWLFPYPLSKVVGRVIIEKDMLVGVGLRGEAGGQPVAGGFKFHRWNDEWYGNLQIRSDGAMAIDEKVISALTVRGQPTSAVERFVRSLEPTGTFRIKNANFSRQINDLAIWHKELDIEVADCSMLYQGFQYPLHRIHGRIVATDDHWQLQNFEGWNDSGRIQCNGEWYDRREEGIPFQLTFMAHSLPMEEELQRALPQDARQLWDQIRPSGAIDQAMVQIVRPTGDAKIDLEVVLHEDNHANNSSGQSLRLHPKSFPYWLSDVSCDLTYRPGQLVISQASACNATSRVSLKAQCEQNGQGNWVGQVNWLPTSRIVVDTQLLRALPDSVSGSLIALDLRGPVNMTGVTRFELPIDSVTAPTTEVDLQMELEDVQLGEGKYVDGIRGTLRMVGRRDPTTAIAIGSADIDAMSVKGVPLTRVRGPWALVGNQIFFGSDVNGKFPATSIQPAPDVMADALSGQLVLSGSGQLDTGRFQLKSKLENADFRCMLQDLGVTQAPTDARCQIELSLAGIPWEPQTYSGSGAVHLRDAQLYQLPTMIQLLRKLSIAPSEKAAFHTADVSFTIDGDRIPLKLACEGDLLSLRGSGWTNLRKELDLELYSYVGGRIPVSSVLTPLVAETPYAPFMTLDVDGTLDNPRIERRAFAQLTSLQQVFPDKIGADQDRKRLLGRLRDRMSEDRTADGRAPSDGPMYR